MNRSGRTGAAALALAFFVAGCSGAASTPAPATAAATPAATTASTTTPAAAACGKPTPSGPVYSMATCHVPAPSLAGNLLGDPELVTAYVITPLDYDTSGIKYPVIYMLAGFTDPGNSIAAILGATPASIAGKVSPIIVVASGVNGLGGGFYVNSSVTGNWEDAITKDLVGYVDGHYRTLATAASRGIAGHSMGGSGALSIAMHRADLFGAVFAESPGLFDKDGATDRLGIPAAIDYVLALDARVAGLTPQLAVTQIKNSALGGGEDTQFELAYGAAFAPDPASPTLMEFPFRSEAGGTVRDDAIWAKWEAGFGNVPARIEQYKANLSKLKGIAIDWGTLDEYAWIPKGCEYTVGLLKAVGLDVTGTSFEGGHGEKLSERLPNQLLPFFEAHLAAS
jgi:S-formylglutathione hydrolase